MATFDPAFSAEVFQVQPQGRTRAIEHCLHISRWQLTGKRADDHIGDWRWLPVCQPMTDFHALLPLARGLGVSLGTDAGEGAEVIHPQAHRQPLLGDQLPGQTPGHADIAVVIDDTTEDVPVRFHRWPLGKSADCPGKSSQTKACREKNPLHRATMNVPDLARRPSCPALTNRTSPSSLCN
ncbi:hypothetical protein D3C79_560300 [compost metagenome]